MIIPDINLLVYAYNSDAPDHRKARAWWENALSASQPVALPWVVLLGFLRIMTSRRILVAPLMMDEAITHVRSWLEQPQTRIIHPGPRHLDLVQDLAVRAGVTGDMTTDLHLAALAIEHQAELHSNDADFRRFPGLRWNNPLN
ncbi:MAG TPA: type II toxin-antitoxin system VapC family toxin [Thermoanaerobaculia bacterium]|jgi:toxin-antitoxin system PIN domain toxin|nr:type II toxin-antitoxin system VapC family toxin [Thermoanaerobaculia bacterium]